MEFKRSVIQNGSSLMVNIPSEIVDFLELKKSDTVIISEKTVYGERIVILKKG